MAIRSSTFSWRLASILLLTVSCGDEMELQDEPDFGPCGPNGRLHSGPGADPHCHCDDGFRVVDGTCVERTPAPEPVTSPSGPDCGPNGDYDGISCVCDAGYTQTGVRDQRTCEAIPACRGADDGYEPNDVPRDATLLSEVDGTLHACPANLDWYVFPVTAGDRVAVEIQFDGSQVDLDLWLYGPSSRNPLAFSLDVVSDREVAGFIARADGTAGILVEPYGIGEGSYTMSVRVEEGEAPMCQPPGGPCRTSQDCCSNSCHVGHCH